MTGLEGKTGFYCQRGRAGKDVREREIYGFEVWELAEEGEKLGEVFYVFEVEVDFFDVYVLSEEFFEEF